MARLQHPVPRKRQLQHPAMKQRQDAVVWSVHELKIDRSLVQDALLGRWLAETEPKP